jgi:hypothetical protein
VNIFYLDQDPVDAARMQCDKHVVKMTLETAQILSTVTGGPYKPTHQKHPSVLWAAKHVHWVYDHFRALLDEYEYRYKREHKCAELVFTFQPFADAPWTDPPQCMPVAYHQASTVAAYRAYYKGEKSRFAKWARGRSAPAWYLAQ